MMPSADGGTRGAPQSAGAVRSVHFAPVDAILAEPLPFGTAWQVEGDSGIGKTILASHFAIQGLAGASPCSSWRVMMPQRVRASLQRLGFSVSSYERQGSFVLVDAFSEGATSRIFSMIARIGGARLPSSQGASLRWPGHG